MNISSKSQQGKTFTWEKNHMPKISWLRCGNFSQKMLSLKCESPLTTHAAYFLGEHCAALYGIAFKTIFQSTIMCMSGISGARLQVRSSNGGQLLMEFRLQHGWLVVFIHKGKEIQEKNSNLNILYKIKLFLII